MFSLRLPNIGRRSINHAAAHKLRGKLLGVCLLNAILELKGFAPFRVMEAMHMPKKGKKTVEEKKTEEAKSGESKTTCSQ
jgi:hypothetical protein